MDFGNIVIESATVEDADSLLDLQRLAFAQEALLYGGVMLPPQTQTLEELVNDFGRYHFLKIMCIDEIIGSVKYRNNAGKVWVGRLMVEPRFRKRGLGRKLMTEVERRNPDASEFELFTGNLSISNMRLYESLGYERKDEFMDEAQPGVVLVRMVKTASCR